MTRLRSRDDETAGVTVTPNEGSLVRVPPPLYPDEDSDDGCTHDEPPWKKFPTLQNAPLPPEKKASVPTTSHFTMSAKHAARASGKHTHAHALRAAPVHTHTRTHTPTHAHVLRPCTHARARFRRRPNSGSVLTLLYGRLPPRANAVSRGPVTSGARDWRLDLAAWVADRPDRRRLDSGPWARQRGSARPHRDAPGRLVSACMEPRRSSSPTKRPTRGATRSGPK